MHIKGHSAEVNDDAKELPETTLLELQCAGKQSQELIITSYSDEQAFNWSPQTCKNVILTIEFKNKKLTKKSGQKSLNHVPYVFFAALSETRAKSLKLRGMKNFSESFHS